MNLADSVVLVTGGARGLGEAFARGIVAAGGRVMIGDLLDEEGAAVAASLTPAGSGAAWGTLMVVALTMRSPPRAAAA